MEETLYGMGFTPRQVRAMSFRKIMQCVRARAEQQRANWRKVATLGAFIINCAGFGSPDRAVNPPEVIPQAFPRVSSRAMSRERYEENYERHLERVEREQQNGEAD